MDSSIFAVIYMGLLHPPYCVSVAQKILMDIVNSWFLPIFLAFLSIHITIATPVLCIVVHRFSKNNVTCHAKSFPFCAFDKKNMVFGKLLYKQILNR